MPLPLLKQKTNATTSSFSFSVLYTCYNYLITVLKSIILSKVLIHQKYLAIRMSKCGFHYWVSIFSLHEKN